MAKPKVGFSTPIREHGNSIIGMLLAEILQEINQRLNQILPIVIGTCSVLRPSYQKPANIEK